MEAEAGIWGCISHKAPVSAIYMPEKSINILLSMNGAGLTENLPNII